MGQFLKRSIILSVGIVMSVAASVASAQQVSLGSVFKSAAQAAGQAAVAQLCPQAQQTVDAAKRITAPAEQQNFMIAKAKEYLAAKNYQPAYDLAGYVMKLDPKSVSAQKIMTDAKAGLTKMVQDEVAARAKQNTAVSSTTTKVTAAQAKVNQVQSSANQTVTGVKGLLGSFK